MNAIVGRRGLLLGSAGILALTACGTGSGTVAQAPSSTTGPPPPTGTGTATVAPSAPASAAPSTPAPSTPAPSVPAILDFTATTVDGREFTGAEVSGRPVLLWFWAPWCPTCRSQIPQVTSIASTYGERLGVVGVGSLDEAEAIRGFAEQAPGITHLVDPEGIVWRRFAITQQSSLVLLDAQGGVVSSTGYGGDDEIRTAIEQIVGR